MKLKTLFASVLALLALHAQAAERPLLSAEQLAARLAAGGAPPLILDASPPPLHAAGHIEGAVSVDVFSYASGMLTPAQLAQRMRAWGLSAGRPVVITDQGGSYMATHLYYELYRQGFPMDEVYLLDGGTARWQATGGALTKAPTPAPAAGSFTPSFARDAEVRSGLEEALAASAGEPGGRVLVDALEPAYYYGARAFFGRGGHLPHAKLWPAEDFFNADKTFKPAAELARMRERLGISPEQEVHSYCGGGVAASVPFFALKFLLGQPRVKLFAGSQQQWLRDERGLPLWSYAAPALLRDAQWLAGWNTAMTRAFGVARISVIDLRSPEAFARNHLPFAQNLPAALWRQHAAEPARLAELLAAAGVKPQDEAVLVGDGGLDPGTALAFFALLEAQGQQRASVLLESTEDWAFAGLPLESKPAAARPVQRSAAAAASNAGNSSSTSTRRVSLDVGARASGRAQLHIPYTALLDDKRRPKPAAALWQLFDKAGLPRNAQIIVLAEDPGEAAVGRFVLKLMGYI